jgi:hypothetical protein
MRSVMMTQKVTRPTVLRQAQLRHAARRPCSGRFLLGTRRLDLSSTRTCKAGRSGGRLPGPARATIHRVVDHAEDARASGRCAGSVVFLQRTIATNGLTQECFDVLILRIRARHINSVDGRQRRRKANPVNDLGSVARGQLESASPCRLETLCCPDRKSNRYLCIEEVRHAPAAGRGRASGLADTPPPYHRSLPISLTVCSLARVGKSSHVWPIVRIAAKLLSPTRHGS